jgi:hypothetical protein
MEINYDASPTIANFMQSEAFFRLIAGPVGSGKTTGCLIELLRRSFEQEPSLIDGLRKTRFAILRQTLSQLKNTVLKDVVAWFGPIAFWKVSESTVHFVFRDVRSEWLLLPMSEPEDQRRLLSLQLTGAMISEAIETDRDLLGPIAGRCGRYPSPVDGGATWYGIIADTNMPSEGSPWHELMENPPPGHDVFRQPSGLDPKAENLNYLLQTPQTLKLPLDHPVRVAKGREYYERLAETSNVNWVRRYVLAEYAPDPSGTAVFKDIFIPRWHVVEAIEPIENAPLIVGMDFGRDPCAVIGQVDWRGRLLVLGEIPAEDIGLTAHMMTMRAHLSSARYAGKRICIVGDPSGQYKTSNDETTAFDILKRSGFIAVPAPTNLVDPRLRAVEGYMLRQVMGGPAILFDRRHCRKTIWAMSGAYRYAYNSLGEAQPKPEKTEPSHYADALQYLCLGATGTTSLMIARKMAPRRARAERSSSRGWT